MFQLRIYTLRSARALERYATVHWARHVPSLATFRVTTHGIWTRRGDDDHRLIALLSYPDSADVEVLTRDFMASSEFAADMDGFDPQDIVAVDSMRLDPDSVGAVRRKDRRLPPAARRFISFLTTSGAEVLRGG
jgi:DNA-binding transcriptional LysR family regulator